ncbi:MAG: LLM class flavin-dependent oxidoreductase, partial [Actinobacteria bacterium]|nr:LLM class flavin-dependent oxidoreductase [Actinomycetota bacterium]
VQHGFEFRDIGWRLARFREQLEIVHRQLDEAEPFDFDGEHYRLRGSRALPKPVQRPLPIIVGGSAKRGTADPAAQFADEYNTIFASPEECRRRRRRLDEACERAGRDPATLPLSLMTFGLVGADRAGVERRLRRREGLPRDADATIVGTVDEVCERLAEYQEAGVVRVMLQHLLHDDLEMVELLGREIAPRVA